MPEIQKPSPEGLRPYIFHGINLSWKEGDSNALGDCPWCGRERHFSISVKTGQWRCYVCGEGTEKGGGNLALFLHRLWKLSDEATKDYTELQTDRRLLYPETLAYWGVCRSMLDGKWLAPGYNAEGLLTQLYSLRWAAKDGKRRLFPTPTLKHQGIHGTVSASSRMIYLCEGLWDGMSLWEILGHCKWSGEDLVQTANPDASLLANSGVLAVPGCNVFQLPWLQLFAGLKVVLLYHSDYPQKHPKTGREIPPAGYAATRRVARLLSEAKVPPEAIQYLPWGERGYDPSKPSGYDIRDCLSEGKDLGERIKRLQGLLAKLQDVPREWLSTAISGSSGKNKDGSQRSSGLGTLKCQSYKEMILAWRKALRWRPEIESCFQVMLAVALSTDRVGDQLFLQVIGDAGSGKTRLCDAMLTSSYCYEMENATGFFSGWKDPSGEDFSAIARANHKTWITPEGDTVMSSPYFAEIMSQQRRIFDGKARAPIYKNRSTDIDYEGLRTPWIIAGTPALMDTDQSRLGDRFLRVCIYPPDEDERREILRRVAFTALRSVIQTSDGDARSHIDERLRLAYQLTGGYVDYLRENAESLLMGLDIDEEALANRLPLLGEFTATMRARPNRDPHKEVSDSKEMPTRLTHQFVRLACCLAAVTQKSTVDTDILAVVRKVAIDTGRGRTLAIISQLADHSDGLDHRTLALYAGQPPDRLASLLRFLKNLEAVEVFQSVGSKGELSKPKWRLTDRMSDLYSKVMENADA